MLRTFDPAPVYQLRARRSDTLAIVRHITDFSAAQWQHHLYQLGTFEVRLVFDDELVGWADGEGLLEILRDGEVEYAGIVDDFDFDDETGEGRVAGVDARAMLGWREILPPDGAESDDQLAVAASAAIRHYVESNLTSPGDIDRDVDGDFGGGVQLLVSAATIGTTVNRQERFGNLLATAFEIAREGSIFFRVVPVSGPDYQLSFSSFTDKSASLLFSLGRGTALSLRAAVDRRDYANVAYVVGQRHEADQTVYEVTDLDNGSMYRRERVFSAGGAATRATLTIEDVTQLWTDWGTEPISDRRAGFPDTWSRRWNLDILDFEIETSGLPTGATGGAALRMAGAGSAGSLVRSAMSFDYLGPLGGPVEVIARVRVSHTEMLANIFTLIMHGGGEEGGSEDGYLLGLHGQPAPSTTEWAAQKLIAGALSELIVNDSQNVNVNTWYRVRMRKEKGYLSAVVGADNGSSTETWFAEVEDPAFDEGWIGLGRESTPAGEFPGTVWVDWLGVGLKGTAAPQSLPAQQVTIGSRTYTFTWDMDVADNVLPSLSGEEMAARLAAAINGEAGAGEIYGSGTAAHPDVVATADGKKLSVLAKGTSGSNIALSTTLHNGAWDRAQLEMSVLSGVANAALLEGARRVRSYQVAPNPLSARYRDAVELGDVVSVRSGRLGVTDTKVVSAVQVQLDQARGEQVQLTLGDLPKSLIDALRDQQRDIRALKTR